MTLKQALFRTIDTSWPAARAHRVGPWLVREGQGGGQRVSAASAAGDWRPEDIDGAESKLADLGQGKLFQIGPNDAALDAELATRGYKIKDPVDLLVAPISELTAKLPNVTAFAIWPPLAIQEEIWDEGGIGPARLAVMERCDLPKTSLMGRHKDLAAATAYIACDGPLAMLHALEVAPRARRQGMGEKVMRAAANWAAEQGAETLAVLVTRENLPAQRLYASLGMTPVENYHYRIKRG